MLRVLSQLCDRQTNRWTDVVYRAYSVVTMSALSQYWLYGLYSQYSYTRKGTSSYYVIIEEGRGVASLMTTDDKGEGGIDRTDDVIKTVIL